MRFRTPRINVQDSSAPQAEVVTYAPGSPEEATRLAKGSGNGQTGANLAIRQRKELAAELVYAGEIQRTQQAIQRRIYDEKRRAAEGYARSFTGRIESAAGKYAEKLGSLGASAVGFVVGGPAGAAAGYTIGEASDLAKKPDIPDIKFEQVAYATPASIAEKQKYELDKSLSYAPIRSTGGNVAMPRETRARAENTVRPTGFNPHSAPDFLNENWDI